MTKRIANMNNLQLLLSTKFWTIKDLHAEVILIMCHTLLVNYLEDERNNKDKVNDVITPEENALIYNTMEELFKYLSKTVYSYSRLEEIIESSFKSTQNFTKARFIEPYAYYYNVLINAFSSRLDFVTPKDAKKQYIPDLLVIELIMHFQKEHYKSAFKRFDYIENLDLNSLYQIYINVQYKERVHFNKNLPIQEQTLIRKMRNVARYMVDKMVETKYLKVIKNKKR